MPRVMNFNAGPAALPSDVLELAQQELLDYQGTGMSIMEHSHRGKAYSAVHDDAVSLVREVLKVSDDYEVLFLQGGASTQFAVLPMNLLKAGQSADYIMTGSWSKKAFGEAKTVGTVRSACSTEVDKKFVRVPKQRELDLDPKAAYCHFTTNNTIAGTQFDAFPDSGQVPLVADMSSDILWRPTDVSKFGMIYAGAQKNIGPSGLALVIIRKDLVEAGREDIPKIFQYRTHASNNSLYHTPPTFAIYMLRNVLARLKKNGGLGAVEKHNRAKGKLLYDAIEARPDFYRCPVEEGSRSLMNVVFNLNTPELEASFIEKAQAAGMVGLKGHRSVGGVRASIYNGASIDWLEALASFMNDFHKDA